MIHFDCNYILIRLFVALNIYCLEKCLVYHLNLFAIRFDLLTFHLNRKLILFALNIDFYNPQSQIVVAAAPIDDDSACDVAIDF